MWTSIFSYNGKTYRYVVNGATVKVHGEPPYSATASVTMSAAMIGPNTGGQPHENRSPFLALNWCIALIGVFPSRS